MRTLLLEEMTWPEIQAAVESGMRTVVIFAASIEQHGPHLAENTDTVIGYHQAVDLARRLGDALVAPVIRPGLSPHHMSFPGSLTLRLEVFEGIVEDYIAAYVRHGFRTIILSSSHGGNFEAMERIAERESEKYPAVKIISGYSMRDLDHCLLAGEQEFALPNGSCGGHACCYETSLMLEIAPDNVRMTKARPGYVGEVTDELLARFFNEGVASVSDIGVMGDPTCATVEIGRALFKRMQDLQERRIREKLGE